MQPTRRRLLALTSALSAVAAPLSVAWPQAPGWPSKPIRIIVPGTPGGVTDVRARWLADRLSPVLGQPIVIENCGGAGGNLGTVAGARSAPDGYTLLIIHIGTMAINPHIYANPGYDPLTDLVPITRLGVGPQVLVVHKSVPANSVSELVALAKAKPGELSFNSPGVGTPGTPCLEPVDAPHRHPCDPCALQGWRAGSHRSGRRACDLEHRGPHHPEAVHPGWATAPACRHDRETRQVDARCTDDGRGRDRGYDFTAWAGIGAPAGTPAAIINRLYARDCQNSGDAGGARLVRIVRCRGGGGTPKHWQLWCVPSTPSWAKSLAPSASRSSRSHRSWRTRDDAPKGSDNPDCPCLQTASLLLILVIFLRHACGGHRARRRRVRCSTRGDMPAGSSSCPDSRSASRQR